MFRVFIGMFFLELSLIVTNSCVPPAYNAVYDEAQLNPKQCECPQLTKEEISRHFIIPGQSIGGLKLGYSHDAAMSILSKCSQVHRVDYPDSVTYDSQITLGDDGNPNTYTGGSGLRVFLMRDKIIQLKVDSYLYSDELLTKNSLYSDVKAKYPAGLLYRLVGSADINQLDSKDLTYLVDQSKGIAFEFYESKSQVRLVSFIYVFSPSSNFFPLGNANVGESIKLVKV